MRVITEPTVTVISKQVFLEHPEYKIPEDGTDAVKIGAFAAKGCYDSYLPKGRSNEGNQRGIIEHRHGSVLEHVVFGLFIEGITRGVSLELNRHRHLAISQRSTRYVAEEEAAIVLEPYYAELWRKWGYFYPDYLRNSAPVCKHEMEVREYQLVLGHVEAAEQAVRRYTYEVGVLMRMNPLNLSGFDLRKWARGKARNILPHNLETRGTWTGNLRAWRHFIETRSQRDAEPEIRRLAGAVYDALKPLAPVYFSDYEVETVRGLREFTTRFSKV